MNIDRYLLRGTMLPFAATLGILVTLFAGYSLASILADAVNGLLPISVIAALAGLKVLIALDVLTPISLFIGVVIAFGRLQADSELTAMLALGMSPFQLLRPVLKLALGLAVCVAALSLFARPMAYAESHVITRRAAAMLNVNAMQAGTFYASDDGRQVIFLGDRLGRGAGAEAEGVFVVRRRDGRVEVISARDAQPAVTTAKGQRMVELSDAHFYRFDLDNPAKDEAVQASGMSVNPDSALPAPAGYSPVATGSLHLARSNRPPDVAELQWRLSTGISTLLLAILGFSLSRGRPRQSRYARFGPAILAYSAYYLLCTTARTWVEHGEVGRFPGLWWAPAGLALVLAAFWVMPSLPRATRPAPASRRATLLRQPAEGQDAA